MTAPSDLQPCPFCGGKARMVSGRVAEDEGFAQVRCTGCEASTYIFEDDYPPMEQAEHAWNQRSTPAPSEFQRGAEAMRRAVIEDAQRVAGANRGESPLTWAVFDACILSIDAAALEAEAREAGDEF